MLAHKPACVFYWSIPVFSIIIFPLPDFPFHVVIVKVARIKKEKGGIFILSRLFPPLSLPVLRLPCWLHVHGMTYFCFKVWLNGQEKRATCFATYCSNPRIKPVLQQIRLLQVAKNCCKKWRIVLHFATKPVHIARPKTNLFKGRPFNS